MFELARKLREKGILGINERNATLIMPLNPRRFFPRVDDKVLTKKLAIEAGMPVPEMYGTIEHQSEIRNFPTIVEGRDSFVIKPAAGSGGDGIMVIAERGQRRKDTYRTISGTLLGEEELEHHISNVVSGQYSLTGNPDVALIEYCVHFDPLFEKVSFQGVPDIRVIVYKGYPIMSMVRLPTRSSDGKANLHQGAVGAGVDIATGKTLDGVLGNQPVHEHPDTGMPIKQLQIPDWDYILESAAKCYEVTNLGYVGVDMVIDRDLGPLILEMNARPGLNIQIANACGLNRRLRRLQEIYDPSLGPADRARVSRREFAAEARF